GLGEGEVHGVVHVAHCVRVAEANDDAVAVAEVAFEIAGIRRADDLDAPRHSGARLLVVHAARTVAVPVGTRRASNERRRSEFVTTATDESAIAPAASAGLSRTPSGTSTP